MICSKCTHESYCDMIQFGRYDPPITTCYKFKEKQQTNADKIRAMTDIELAEWVASGCDPFPEKWCLRHYKGEEGCIQCWLDWLKQEVNDGD